MKKGLSVIKYILLSLVLFFGGVMIEVSPTDFVKAVTQDVKDLTPDQKDDPDKAKDVQDQAQADDKDKEKEPKENYLRYYYSLLDGTEKNCYDKVCDAIENEEASVELEGIDKDQLARIFQSVYLDWPEYFWLDCLQYTYNTNPTGVILNLNYNYMGAEREKREAIVKQQSEEILAGVPAGGSDYDKVKYVFETLVDMTEYDLSAPDNQNIYSVFGNWTTVCAGYAGATKYLLDRAGVDCIWVTGTGGGGPHAWNIVKCDGQYYYVDTTWGDPGYRELQGEDVTKDFIAYEYLCCSGQMLNQTHTPDTTYPLPECTDTSLEYYRMKGRYLETADAGMTLDIMKQAYNDGKKYIKIQYASNDLMNQIMEQLKGDLSQQMMEYMQAQSGQEPKETRWEYQPASSVLIVYWE